MPRTVPQCARKGLTQWSQHRSRCRGAWLPITGCALAPTCAQAPGGPMTLNCHVPLFIVWNSVPRAFAKRLGWGPWKLLWAIVPKPFPGQSLAVTSAVRTGPRGPAFPLHYMDQCGRLQNWRLDDPFSWSVMCNKFSDTIKNYTW